VLIARHGIDTCFRHPDQDIALKPSVKALSASVADFSIIAAAAGPWSLSSWPRRLLHHGVPRRQMKPPATRDKDTRLLVFVRLGALCCVIRERPGVPCRQVRAADESNDRSSSREGQLSDDTGPVIVDGSTPNKKGKQPVPTVPADVTRFLRIENVQVDDFHPQDTVRPCQG
jgi:hypothetical protein